MNCPGCGHTVEKDAQFCPKCFARIEPPSLWQRFLGLFQSAGGPSRRVVNIKKTITIKTTDKDGRRHEYHSLEEAPPEIRAEMERLEAEAAKEQSESMVAETRDGMTSKLISTKSVSLFEIKDASGQERTYHSLEELPPEIRAALEQAQKKIDSQQA